MPTTDSVAQAARAFVDICYAAREKNDAALETPRLRDALNVCSATWPFLTPAGFLAREGDRAAVVFLAKKGAQALDIAMGYAMAGNPKMVERYCPRSGMSDEAAIKIASSYAMGAHHQEVQEHQMRCCRIDGIDAAITWGYAVANKPGYVERYRNKYEAVDDSIIAEGYAKRGICQKVEEYRQKHNKSHHEIVLLYADVGNHDQAEKYRQEHNIAALDIMLLYIGAHKHDKAEEYRQAHNIAVTEIVLAYAKSGNHVMVDKYLDQRHDSITPEFVAEAYAAEGDSYLVERYLKRYKNISHAAIARGFESGGHREHAACYRDQIITLSAVAEKAVVADDANGFKQDQGAGAPLIVAPPAAAAAVTAMPAAAPVAAMPAAAAVTAMPAAVTVTPAVVPDAATPAAALDVVTPAAAAAIARDYAKAGTYQKVDEYQRMHNIPHFEIVLLYADVGNHDQAEKYRQAHNIAALDIMLLYIGEHKHDKAEEYRQAHNIAVTEIVGAYAESGNHVMVDKYLDQRHDSITPEFVAEAYAAAGYRKQVGRCLSRYPNINRAAIVRGFEKGGYGGDAARYRDQIITLSAVAEKAVVADDANGFEQDQGAGAPLVVAPPAAAEAVTATPAAEAVTAMPAAAPATVTSRAATRVARHANDQLIGFNTAMASLNRVTFLDPASPPAVKFAALRMQCAALPAAQKRDVAHAMTALFTYSEALAQHLSGEADQVAKDALKLARQETRMAFETAIKDMPGHSNALVRGIGITLMSIGAAIALALVASPLLALVSLSAAAAAIAVPAAYVLPTALTSVALGAVAVIGIFGSRSTGAHRQAQELANMGAPFDEQAAAVTRIDPVP